jgi:hypothetical protein
METSPLKTFCGKKRLANRLALLKRGRPWITAKASKLMHWFASGNDVDPAKITPLLIQVKSEEQQALFRFARYTWSLPYSKGYGRRLKFLIIDDHNGKLIGLLELQSPPLDFSLRDSKFAYALGRKIVTCWAVLSGEQTGDSGPGLWEH